MQPVLRQTQNYNLFELHKFNRDVRGAEKLRKSMQKRGFIPHKAIECIKNGSGKLVVIAGHHRLTIARELGIPVWYILADDYGMTIQEAEDSTTHWDLKDYLTSYVRNGIAPYIACERYIDETGIPLGMAISILAGESAGSANKVKAFKSGKYTLGDQSHANQVKSIVLVMKKSGIAFATNAFFIQALSKVLWVEAFSVARFKAKIKSHSQHFEKQPNVQMYLDEIERIYNRQSKDRLPLAFLAIEKAKERHLTFGKNDH